MWVCVFSLGLSVCVCECGECCPRTHSSSHSDVMSRSPRYAVLSPFFPRETTPWPEESSLLGVDRGEEAGCWGR